MTAEQIEELLAEVSEALAANESAALSEAELAALLRRLGPVAELVEQRWRRCRPGGPDFLRVAHRDVRGAEAASEAIRLQRAQIEAQRQTLSDLRRVARRREALTALPKRYAETAAAVQALEAAWAQFETMFSAVGTAAQSVAAARANAGGAAGAEAPDAPDDAEALPARLLEVARAVTARSNHLLKWPSDIASALSVDEPRRARPAKAEFYENV